MASKKKGKRLALPRGFKPAFDPLGAISQSLKAAQKAIQTESAESLSIKRSLDVKVRIHENRDESIDGELLIADIPRGVSVDRIVMEVERHLIPLGTHLFVSTGLRFFAPEEVRKTYTRYRGMAQAQTYWRRMTKTKLATSLLMTRAKINTAMVKHRRNKATQFFVRVHWSPDEKKPKRG